MKQPKMLFLDYWYMALAAPYGKEVFNCSPDFETVRQALYRTRTEARDDDLKGLAVLQSPFDPSTIWIVKKEPDTNATP